MKSFSRPALLYYRNGRKFCLYHLPSRVNITKELRSSFPSVILNTERSRRRRPFHHIIGEERTRRRKRKFLHCHQLLALKRDKNFNTKRLSAIQIFSLLSSRHLFLLCHRSIHTQSQVPCAIRPCRFQQAYRSREISPVLSGSDYNFHGLLTIFILSNSVSV